MISPKDENLIVKFLNRQASVRELDDLWQWLQKPTNEQYFKSYIKTNFAMDCNMKTYNTQQVKVQLLAMIAKDTEGFKLKRTKTMIRYAAAAILVIALASTLLLKDTLFNDQIENTAPIIVNNQIEPGTDRATLTLEDGSEVTLGKGTDYQTANATSNGETIIYQANQQPTPSNQHPSTINYNTLTIPRGAQFSMTLSDGTKVWLNSESQIKYPVAFNDGETRQVELLYGEAYFDVSPSTEHKGSKFKVYHHAQEVEVLGTEFNIKAYKDETNIYTTLVEGKVAVNYGGIYQILVPMQQSNLDIQNDNMTIATVNVYYETSWKEGVFNFKAMALKDIMKVLSRWYDMDVVFENKELETIDFIGTFNKNRSIEEILLAIKETDFINNYEIHNKTITIK